MLRLRDLSLLSLGFWAIKNVSSVLTLVLEQVRTGGRTFGDGIPPQTQAQVRFAVNPTERSSNPPPHLTYHAFVTAERLVAHSQLTVHRRAVTSFMVLAQHCCIV